MGSKTLLCKKDTVEQCKFEFVPQPLKVITTLEKKQKTPTADTCPAIDTIKSKIDKGGIVYEVPNPHWQGFFWASTNESPIVKFKEVYFKGIAGSFYKHDESTQDSLRTGSITHCNYERADGETIGLAHRPLANNASLLISTRKNWIQYNNNELELVCDKSITECQFMLKNK